VSGHGEKNYLDEAMEDVKSRLKAQLRAEFEQKLHVPREMTAREFWAVKNRMCGIHYVNCNACPLGTENNNMFKPCTILEKENPEVAISIVEQWAKEHPERRRKTYAEDFFEKFPKAEPKYYDGRGKEQMIPIPCRQHCYGVVGRKCNGIGCSCSACWNEEMEGEE